MNPHAIARIALLLTVSTVLLAQPALGGQATTREIAKRTADLRLDERQSAELCALASGSRDCIELLGRYESLQAPGIDHSYIMSVLVTEYALRRQGALAQAEKQFLGITFGIGLGVSVDLESGDRIDGAEVVDGIVRVTKKQNALPRVVLEAHYFLLHNGDKEHTKATFGQGPFIALQTSGDEVIAGFGSGWMWGWRYTDTSPSSFNLGAGLILDANVEVLGEDVETNQPPPGNETTVRIAEESRVGMLLFASFTF